MTNEPDNLGEQQLERVARYLDGERIDLSPAELAVARDLQAAQASVGPALNADQGADIAVARARRQLQAASAHRLQPRRLAVRIVTLTAAAAAAVVLLALALRNAPTPTTSAPGNDQIASKPVTPSPNYASVDVDAWLSDVTDDQTDPMTVLSVMTMDDHDLRQMADNSALEWIELDPDT